MESNVKSVARLSAAKLVLYAGTGFSGILLARLLGPADYGIMTIVLSIAGILGILLDMNLSSAAIKFGSEAGARKEDFVTTAFVSRSVLGLLGLLVFILVAKPVADRYGVPSAFLLLMAFGYFLQSPLALRSLWNIERRFRLLSLVEGATGIFYFVVMLAFAYFFRLAGVFYAIVIISAFMGASSFLKYRTGIFDVQCLKKMLPFGFWGMLVGLFTYIVQNFDKWFLGLYVIKEQLGHYALAYKAAYFLMLVPFAVQMVVYPEFSNLFSKRNTQEIKRLFNKTVKLCLVYAVIGSIFIIVTFDILVKYFLTKYSAALPFLPFLLVPFILEAGIGSVSWAVMGSVNRVNEMALITFIQAAITLTVGKEFIKTGGIWGAIAALWLAYAVSSVLYLWRVRKIFLPNDLSHAGKDNPAKSP